MAFDHVTKKVIWWALRRKGAMKKEIQAIKEMCRNVSATVRLYNKRTECLELMLVFIKDLFLAHSCMLRYWMKYTKILETVFRKNF